MTPEEFNRCEDLFHRAMALPEAARRDFLARECGAESALLRRVEELLRQAGDEDFLRPPGATEVLGAAPSMRGRRVGGYVIERLIAEGGMGAVYEASQERPHRRVALKVLKATLASPSAVRRLEFESQVLARLQHPSIAQIYEAGVDGGDHGRAPYFAMELVEGARTITAFAEEEKLPVRDRLVYFLHVCGAVHHGHQRGVIHRDLKPANILVDSHGVVKIIDFGIARVTCIDGEPVRALATQTAGFSGTLAYMAPEQCAPGPGSADIRCDVYALGVVLYQLLTGRLPYDVSHQPLPIAASIIRNDLPVRPSEVVWALRGDIETVVLKALEKEPERRYQSAAELARDIERFLNLQPIDARPPTLRYQLRMFARRHRPVVLAAAAVAVTLVGATAVSSVFAARARAAAAKAEAARARAERTAEFLRSTLVSANPMLPARIDEALRRSEFDPFGDWRDGDWEFAGLPGQAATVADTLRKAATQLPRWFADDPQTKAALSEAIGWTLFRLDRSAEAEPLVREAFSYYREHEGLDHPLTIQSTLRLAECVQNIADRHEDARPLYEEAVASCTRVYGRDDYRTLGAIRKQASFISNHLRQPEVAAELMREWCDRISLKPVPDLRDIELLVYRALFLSFAGKSTEAIVLADRAASAIQSGPYADSMAAASVLTLAAQSAERQASDSEKAERWLVRAIEIRVKKVGEGGYDHAIMLTNLANVRRLRGDTAGAVAAFRESHRLFQAMYGDRHFETLRALGRLGELLSSAEPKNPEGGRMCRQAGEGMLSLFGRPESYGVAFLVRSAEALWAGGDREGSIRELRQTMQLVDQVPVGKIGTDLVQHLTCALAERLSANGQDGPAMDTLQKGLEIAKRHAASEGEYKGIADAIAARQAK